MHSPKLEFSMDCFFFFVYENLVEKLIRVWFSTRWGLVQDDSVSQN